MVDQHSQHVDNWSAAGMAGMFDAVHRQRDRARYRRRVFLWCLTIAVCLGVPLGITWVNLQDARRQTLMEEFDSKRSSSRLLTLSNPAVESAISEADSLRESAQTRNVAESIPKLRQALALLTEADNLDRDTKRLREQLDPIGVALIETPWHTSSAVIASKQKTLSNQHGDIVFHLDQGEVSQAEQKLATLLSDIGKLQRGNVEAMRASLTMQAWESLKASVPGRLNGDPGWTAIIGVGIDATEAWNAGDWSQARTLYARAVERAHPFLKSALSPNDLAELLQSDANDRSRLLAENSALQDDLTALEQQNAALSKQLISMNEERQTALADLKSLTAERDRLKKSESSAAAQLKQLETTRAELAISRQQIVTLKDARQKDAEALNQLTLASNALEKAHALIVSTPDWNGFWERLPHERNEAIRKQVQEHNTKIEEFSKSFGLGKENQTRQVDLMPANPPTSVNSGSDREMPKLEVDDIGDPAPEESAANASSPKSEQVTSRQQNLENGALTSFALASYMQSNSIENRRLGGVIHSQYPTSIMAPAGNARCEVWKSADGEYVYVSRSNETLRFRASEVRMILPEK